MQMLLRYATGNGSDDWKVWMSRDKGEREDPATPGIYEVDDVVQDVREALEAS